MVSYTAVLRSAHSLLAASILSTTASSSAAAQQAQPAPPRPGWLPAQYQWDGGMSAAHRATAMTVLREFERLLLDIPELARPNGFQIEPAFAGGYRPMGPNDRVLPNSIVRYNYGLMMFAPTKAIAGEGRVCVSVIVNDDPPTEKHRGDNGLKLYIQSELFGKTVPHATEVHGELWNVPGERSFVDVVFVSAGELPWRTVTREELINALIFEAEGKDGTTKSELDATFSKTPYQEWMEGAAERKRTNEQTLRDAATIQSPAEVAKLRKTLEDTERDVTERLRQSEAEDRKRMADARAGVSEYGDSLRAVLARMTPAERRIPALVDNTLTEGPLVAGYRLTADPAPPAWQIRTPNYAFWRFRRSPVEVRSIRVSIGMSGTCLKPEIQRALLQTFQKLDWAAFHQRLDIPR